jgi:hypothetical protein
MAGYVIYTERIDGNGSIRRDNFECNQYTITDGYVEFWNPKLTERHLISIHKMDHILIKDKDGNSVKENMKGDEIKCTT